MSDKQRQHEKYWGSCWAVPLGQHMDAEVHSIRPDEDPPDIEFHIRRRDGTVMNSWGEVTGAYYDSNEAKWLWGTEPKNKGGIYWEPDALMGVRARDLVEHKRKKYRELAQRRGPGHLLVLLNSPLTTRNTRVKAEESILDLLKTGPDPEFDPFKTVWLGYRLPYTSPEEQEDPQYAFRDALDGERFNFMKCIWNRPDA